MREAKHFRAFVIILAITFVALVAGIGKAQSAYNAPKQVSINAVVKRTFPDYFARRSYPRLEAEGFYPIGWARDGKFAYYTEPVDEACGCYYAKLVIQDLRTDKVIWKFDYDQSDEMDEDGKMPPYDTIDKLWAKNKDLFDEKLAENGIVASRSVLLGKSFLAKGRTYTAKLVEKRGPNPEEYDDRVNYYTVSLSTSKLGSKKLFTSEDHTKDDYWFMLDAGLIGVLKSPYENRVAIIAIDVMRGYEGPPHTGDIRIVGADLVNGFGR